MNIPPGNPVNISLEYKQTLYSTYFLANWLLASWLHADWWLHHCGIPHLLGLDAKTTYNGLHHNTGGADGATHFASGAQGVDYIVKNKF